MSPLRPTAFLFALLTAVVLVESDSVSAHAAPFSYLDLRITGDGIDGSLVVHDYDVAHDVGVNDVETLRNSVVADRYRDMLTRLMESRLAIITDGTRRAIEWTTFEVVPDKDSLRLGLRIATPRAGDDARRGPAVPIRSRAPDLRQCLRRRRAESGRPFSALIVRAPTTTLARRKVRSPSFKRLSRRVSNTF